MAEKPEEIQDAALVPASGQPDASQVMKAKLDSVAELLKSAYSKAGELRLSKKESDLLLQSFPDDAFRPGAAGKESLIYIEHANLRDRFNQALGMGQWTLIPIREWSEDFEFVKWENNQKRTVPAIRIYREMALMVRGCFVGAAVGDCDYIPSNQQMNYGDAYEGAKTAAFRRAAKEFGVGGQAWLKEWCDGWWQRRRQGGSTRPEDNGMKPGAKNTSQQRQEDVSRGEQIQQGGNQAPPQQQGGQQYEKWECPKCGKMAVGRSMYPPRGKPNAPKGYHCYEKSGGCKANFPHDDPSFSQHSEPEPPAQGIDKILSDWTTWNAGKVSNEQFNQAFQSSQADNARLPEDHRKKLWAHLKHLADQRGLVYDKDSNSFIPKS